MRGVTPLLSTGETSADGSTGEDKPVRSPGADHTVRQIHGCGMLKTGNVLESAGCMVSQKNQLADRVWI